MAVFAVFYTYDDRYDLRMQTRLEHRAFLKELLEQGRLLAAGAYADDLQPGGLLAFRGDSADEIAAVLDGDPYHRVGVITDRVVRAWGAALGPWVEFAG